jgi:hypothetical protein
MHNEWPGNDVMARSELRNIKVALQTHIANNEQASQRNALLRTEKANKKSKSLHLCMYTTCTHGDLFLENGNVMQLNINPMLQCHYVTR